MEWINKPRAAIAFYLSSIGGGTLMMLLPLQFQYVLIIGLIFTIIGIWLFFTAKYPKLIKWERGYRVLTILSIVVIITLATVKIVNTTSTEEANDIYTEIQEAKPYCIDVPSDIKGPHE